MKTITKNTVVEIEYRLTNSDGNIIDSSEGYGPLAYLHGNDNLIPGLEAALEGKCLGDELEVTVAPADGYGERDEDLVRVVARDRFDVAGDELEVGMQFQAETEHGIRVFTITEVGSDAVKVDGNHPLAGETLQFWVKVVGLRAASPEEIAHGHVHGPGHHH